MNTEITIHPKLQHCGLTTGNLEAKIVTRECSISLQPGDEILTTTQEHEAFYGTLARLEELNGIVGAWIDGEYGKPETWREIILVNPAIVVPDPPGLRSPQLRGFTALCIPDTARQFGREA